MLDTVMWFVGLAGKIMAIVLGWYLFVSIIHHGGDTAREVIKTIGLVLRSACKRLQIILRARIKRDEKELSGEDDETKVEGHIV